MLPIFQNYAPDVLEQCSTPTRTMLHAFKNNALRLQEQCSTCSKAMSYLFKSKAPSVRKECSACSKGMFRVFESSPLSIPPRSPRTGEAINENQPESRDGGWRNKIKHNNTKNLISIRMFFHRRKRLNFQLRACAVELGLIASARAAQVQRCRPSSQFRCRPRLPH